MYRQGGWATAMRRPHQWGDTAALHLASLAYKMQVKLVIPKVRADQPFPHQPRGDEDQPSLAPPYAWDEWPVVFIGLHHEHYMALEVCDDGQYSFSFSQLNNNYPSYKRANLIENLGGVDSEKHLLVGMWRGCT